MTAPNRPRQSPSAAAPEGDAAPDVADLLAKAGSGDEAAWSDLVGRFAPRVFALCRSRRFDPERAEEVTQSVFVSVAQHVRSGEYSERGAFEPWLFRIAMNRIRDEARRVARQATTSAGDLFGRMSASPADNGASADDLRGLRSALESLGDADREVVELRHHADMSFRQIAAALGEPIGTVLARHHRALRKLRDMLDPGADPRADGDER